MLGYFKIKDRRSCWNILGFEHTSFFILYMIFHSLIRNSLSSPSPQWLDDWALLYPYIRRKVILWDCNNYRGITAGSSSNGNLKSATAGNVIENVLTAFVDSQRAPIIHSLREYIASKLNRFSVLCPAWTSCLKPKLNSFFNWVFLWIINWLLNKQKSQLLRLPSHSLPFRFNVVLPRPNSTIAA